MKHLVVRSASPEAKKLVLNIIQTNERPLTIQELYKEAAQSQEHLSDGETPTIHSMRCVTDLLVRSLPHL